MKSTKKSDMKLLREFLQEPTNKIFLAAHLGYTTTHSIDQWVKRGQISHLVRQKAIKYMKEMTR